MHHCKFVARDTYMYVEVHYVSPVIAEPSLVYAGIMQGCAASVLHDEALQL